MGPPTEQLIRDYLNRLSMAGRGQLTAEDRQALVTRTRDFIERNASASGSATAMQVAALLSRLGDPSDLVVQEVARLAAVRGETGQRPVHEGKRPGLLRRRAGQASWHWPRLPGIPDLQVQVLSRPADDEQLSGGAGNGVRVGGSVSPAGTEPDSPAEPDAPFAQTSRREPPIWVPRQPSGREPLTPDGAAPVMPGADEQVPEVGEPSGGERSSGERSGGEPSSGASAGRPSWPSVVALRPGDDRGSQASEDDATARAGQESGPSRALPLSTRSPADGRLYEAGAALLGGAGSFGRRYPVETVAAVLLGLGGAAFPPVWLLGVPVALLSRAWDYRDKWIGLAGPALLLVVGTVAGVSLGSSHTSMGGYVHEAWLYADVLSRVAAVLGAGYLVWRLVRGRRVPPVPPWNRPHRVG
jgi:hypothetical protein